MPSGRAVIYRKRTVEEVCALNMSYLRDNGFFLPQSARIWTSSWTRRGEPAGKVDYWPEGGHGEPMAIHFLYRIQRDDGPWRDFDYRVSVATTPCHFGGS